MAGLFHPLESGGQKLGEGLRRHLASRHHELPMTNLAEARDVAVDRDVVGRVGEDRRRPLGPNQLGMRSLTSSVATEELVPPDEPKIADAGDCRP